MSIDVATYDDLALAVVAEVIGVNQDSGRVIIDAGALALSKDRSTATAKEDFGYGLVSRLGETAANGDYLVENVSQEHGAMLPRPAARRHTKYCIGDRVLVWPNHACITAAAHDSYAVVDGSVEVVATWQRINGWNVETSTTIRKNAKENVIERCQESS